MAQFSFSWYKKDVERSLAFIQDNIEKIFEKEYSRPYSPEKDLFYSGTWTGEYIYGKGYGKNLEGTKVTFTMSIKIEKGIVSGTCFDDDPGRCDKPPATINGNLEGDYINFAKQYPYKLLIMPDGKSVIDETLSSLPVTYNGEYGRAAFFGKWKIQSIKKDNDGVYADYTYSGTWSMRKKLP